MQKGEISSPFCCFDEKKPDKIKEAVYVARGEDSAKRSAIVELEHTSPRDADTAKGGMRTLARIASRVLTD